MRILFHIAMKDLLLRWRDRLGFFWWMLGFPLLISVLIGSIFAGTLESPSQGIRIVLVDEAKTPESATFAEILRESGSVRATPADLPAARDAVRRGKATGLIILKQDFRISPAVFSNRRIPVAVAVDPLRKAESAYLQAAINQAAIEMLRRQWFDPAKRATFINAILADTHREGEITPLERKAIETTLAGLGRFFDAPASRPARTSPLDALSNVEVIPVDVNRIRPKSSFEICFPIGILWGLLALAAEFAMAIVREREAGTLLRLRIAPIARWQILTGTGLASFFASVGVMLVLLSFGHLAFGVRLQNTGALAVAILCIGLCFVGITMFLSVLGTTEAAVGGLAWAFLLIMSMVGGGMVPQMFLPPWMDVAGTVSPVKWAIAALEGGIWRDFTLGEMLRPCGILLLEGMLFGTVGVLVNRRK